MKALSILTAALLSALVAAEAKAEAAPQFPFTPAYGSAKGSGGNRNSALATCKCNILAPRCSGSLCECGNEERINCWVEKRGGCKIDIQPCNASGRDRNTARPTSPQGPFPPCGAGLPDCRTQTYCKSLDQSCASGLNNGNCLGVCVPSFPAGPAPASNDNRPAGGAKNPFNPLSGGGLPSWPANPFTPKGLPTPKGPPAPKAAPPPKAAPTPKGPLAPKGLPSPKSPSAQGQSGAFNPLLPPNPLLPFLPPNPLLPLNTPPFFPSAASQPKATQPKGQQQPNAPIAPGLCPASFNCPQNLVCVGDPRQSYNSFMCVTPSEICGGFRDDKCPESKICTRDPRLLSCTGPGCTGICV